MLVLESASSCGGTWAEHHLYPELKSNNMLGSYEYPDFPMSYGRYSIEENKHIPAATLHRYLTDYAKHFGVFERIHFHTKVDDIRLSYNGGWELTTSFDRGPKTLRTKKVILATGLTSSADIPVYEGQDSFKHSLFHAKYFCANADTLSTSNNAVINGARKSAFDVAFTYANAGVEVDTVIWPDGNGPCF